MTEPNKDMTHEQIRSEIKALSRDRIGPDDPVSMRKLILDLGGTQEEADQAAAAIEQQNRQWEQSQLKAS